MIRYFETVWNWIITNLATIKDLLWIVFTFAATLVAYLTYRRARYTLLQPLRTEVIKRQTDLLVEILDFLFDDGLYLTSKVDYMGITVCNCFQYMREFGFILKNDTIMNDINEKQSGILILKESGKLNFIELPEPFTTEDDRIKVQMDRLNESRQMYQSAKNGMVDIEYIYLTKTFNEFFQKLTYFIENPFIPSSIKQLLIGLREEISYNLKVSMKTAIEEFLLQVCSNHIDKSNALTINPDAVYNSFNHQRKLHKGIIKKILDLTREYLMVDEKWR